MPRADRIPFLPNRALVTVFAKVNGQDGVALVVDSGAQRTVLSRAVAQLVGADLRSPIRLEALAGVGYTQPVPVVRLKSVRIGASNVDDLDATVFDLPPIIRADGLLGL